MARGKQTKADFVKQQNFPAKKRLIQEDCSVCETYYVWKEKNLLISTGKKSINSKSVNFQGSLFLSLQANNIFFVRGIVFQATCHRLVVAECNQSIRTNSTDENSFRRLNSMKLMKFIRLIDKYCPGKKDLKPAPVFFLQFSLFISFNSFPVFLTMLLFSLFRFLLWCY